MTWNERNFGKNNLFFSGRATSALYLILQKENLHGIKVLFPANICYAPVFAVVYAKNYPVFVDIDDWANVSFQSVKAHIESEKSIQCVLIPHMYGKINKDLPLIYDFCNKRGIVVIEDCASAQGGTLTDESVGKYSDYALFSFGHSKIVDVGYGGLVASEKDLKDLVNFESNFSAYSPDTEYSLSLFSKIYREIRNCSRNNSFITNFYRNLPSIMHDFFLFSIPHKKINEIKQECENIESIVIERWRKYFLYFKWLKDCNNIKILEYSDGCVPWRFNFLIKKHRNEFISALLSKNIPVSDWYPCVAKMFGINTVFHRVTEIEHKIINLPLLISDNDIASICKTILEVL